MKKIIIILLITIIPIKVLATKEKEIIIPDEAIRFRVIANSNSINDQNNKIIVRNNVQSKLLKLLKDTENIETARGTLIENKDEIDKIVKDTLKEYNISDKYEIKYGKNYFPEKKYKGTIYPNGEYESLVITLGQGNGDNWWCVLFPPLCLLVAEESTEKVEYKFFIKELIDKYF